MKQRKNKMITILAGATLGVASLAIATNVVKSNTVAANADYTLTMDGAAIRPDENYGIRFIAKASAVRQDSKYYVMIVPESWLTDTEHDLANAENGDYYAHLKGKGLTDVDDPATENVDERDFITMQSTPEFKDGVYEVKGTISKVHYSNTNTKFFGIAYEEKADGTRVYADENGKSVRSIAWVAGAALNDTTTDYSAIKSNLDQTIQDAYNVSLGKKKTDEQSTFNVFSTVKVYSNDYPQVEKGAQHQITLTGMPNIDVPVKYSMTAANSSVNENGLITIGENETGSSNYLYYTVTVAGKKVTDGSKESATPRLRLRAPMAEGVLEDYTVPNGNYHYSFSSNNSCDGGSTTFAGNIAPASECTDANSVSYTGVLKKKSSNKTLALRLGKTNAQLQNLDFTTIKIRAKFANAVTPTFFGVACPAATANVWTVFTVYKADLLAARSGATDAEKWNEFCNLYCATGSGANGLKLSSATTTYIDEIWIEDNTLVSFDTSTQVNKYLTNNTSFADSNTTVKYYETKADTSDPATTEKGVGQANVYYDNAALTMRFAVTESDLIRVMNELNTLTIRIMMERAEADPNFTFSVFGNLMYDVSTSRTVANKWIDVTLTKAEVLNNVKGDTETEKIANFAKAFCSTGNGRVETATGDMAMISAACNKKSLPLYIDEVTFTKVSN